MKAIGYSEELRKTASCEDNDKYKSDLFTFISAYLRGAEYMIFGARGKGQILVGEIARLVLHAALTR